MITRMETRYCITYNYRYKHKNGMSWMGKKPMTKQFSKEESRTKFIERIKDFDSLTYTLDTVQQEIGYGWL